MNIITKKEVEEIAEKSLESALEEFNIVSNGYFNEETLRYIVANHVDRVLSNKKYLVSFPNKKENKYKLVFEYPYTDNKKSRKKNIYPDLAIIRSNAEKFNDAYHSQFYTEVYHKSIYKNEGVIIGKDEVLTFDTNENSFVIYSKFDRTTNQYLKYNYIDDRTACKRYFDHKENIGRKPEKMELENQKLFNGNLLIIELKQFGNLDEVKEDINRLKRILDPKEGFEFFLKGLAIIFGVKEKNPHDFYEYLNKQIPKNRNLLVAFLNPNDNQGVYLKWIN